MSKLRSLPWLAKLGLGSLPILDLVALLGLGGPPAPEIDAIGFQDDTSEPCLGDSDPSYSCGGGGGDSSAACIKCSFTRKDGKIVAVSCEVDSSGGGTACTAHLSGETSWCHIPPTSNCQN